MTLTLNEEELSFEAESGLPQNSINVEGKLMKAAEKCLKLSKLLCCSVHVGNRFHVLRRRLAIAVIRPMDDDNVSASFSGEKWRAAEASRESREVERDPRQTATVSRFVCIPRLFCSICL